MLDDGTFVVLGESEVAWETQGDEWLHWFGVAVAEQVPDLAVAGSKYDNTTKPFIAVPLQRGGALTDLRVLLGVATDHVVALAHGLEEPFVSDELLAGLRDAVSEVKGRLGDPGAEFEWSAIVGHPANRIGGIEKHLEAPGTVGPLRLESSGVILAEPGTSDQSSLSSWALHRSVPIRVFGRSTGYRWDAASLGAARDLRTLCALLTLAWGADVGVKEGPAPLEWGARQVPDRPPWYAPPEFDAESDDADLPGSPTTVPEWVDPAWNAARHGAWRSRALDAYLEGVYAETHHPSLAAVAYTAAVETVAARVFEIPRCPSCGGRHGIAKAFRAALRVVLPETEAEELDPVYVSRSKTVHEGVLHGSEIAPGVFGGGIWTSDRSRDFRWRTLWRLRSAAGRLVKRALMDNLPPKGPLPL